MSLRAFVIYVNKLNGQLEQFQPRDNGIPLVKLAEDKLMDILEIQYPILGKGECIDSDLTVQPKDRPNSSNSANVSHCWTYQSRLRGVDRLPHQQLAISSKH
eukprot:12651378-Ditylum_brightwellii.AAC.1